MLTPRFGRTRSPSANLATPFTCVMKIAVKLRASPYNVVIEGGALHEAGKQIIKALEHIPPQAVVVTSARVRQHWGAALESGLKKAKLKFEVLEIDDGEPSKHLGTVEPLLRKFAERGLDRRSLVIAFGGGVIGDMVGFAASVYMRGIDVVQVPTTLLAQVDAAIGGKTGVNLPQGKNLVGTFHQPRLVVIDPEVLTTLPDREFRAGLFEVIKCGIIRDKSLFEYFEAHLDSVLVRDAKALLRIISASVQVKAEVVAADERESGLRRILNFGHTIGHALEAESSYTKFLHGEAVAWGMIVAANIGVAHGVTHPNVAERITRVVHATGSLPAVTASGSSILRLLQADKKTISGVPHFVLAKQIGNVEITDKIKPQMIEEAIQQLRSNFASHGPY